MNDDSAVATGQNGRFENGRFAVGNRAAAGNRFASKSQRLRAAFLESVTESDVLEVVTALVESAKDGDVSAIRLFLERTLGKPVAHDLLPSSSIDAPRRILSAEEIQHRIAIRMARLQLSGEASE